MVSRLVAEAVPNRRDVYAPGEAVRDTEGRIVGARGLCRVVPATIRQTFGSGPALPCAWHDEVAREGCADAVR